MSGPSTTSASRSSSSLAGPKASSRLSTSAFSGGGGKVSLAVTISWFTLVTVPPITGASSSQSARVWPPVSSLDSWRTRSRSDSDITASADAISRRDTFSRTAGSKRSASSRSFASTACAA